MNTYSRDQAISVLKNGRKGAEVYAWPREYEKTTTFAFIVIYRGKKSEGWLVALHHKVAVDPDKTYFDCIDELDAVDASLPMGGTTRSEFPTVEQSIEFAMSQYSVSEFMDHDAITQKYWDRYLRGAEPNPPERVRPRR